MVKVLSECSVHHHHATAATAAADAPAAAAHCQQPLMACLDRMSPAAQRVSKLPLLLLLLPVLLLLVLVLVLVLVLMLVLLHHLYFVDVMHVQA